MTGRGYKTIGASPERHIHKITLGQSVDLRIEIDPGLPQFRRTQLQDLLSVVNVKLFLHIPTLKNEIY